MIGLEEWWSGGERVELRLGSEARGASVRRMGSGPVMSLLHSFPSSSHDWARLAPALAQGHDLLMPDFLGFGASDKPREHSYSLHSRPTSSRRCGRTMGSARR